jgi:protein SCO1/2
MIRFLSILIVLLLIATSAVLYFTKNKMNEELQTAAPATVQPAATQAATAQIGGAFSLTNQDGVMVSDADFKGKVMVVFFGFTSCPDICPVTSASFAKLLSILGENASQVAPIFISVDPARDTPAVLKKYLSNFDPRIIGLTGSDEQIKQAASTYKTYFSANAESGNVDHSGFIFLMDKNGAYSKHFAYDAPAEEIANAVSELLK